MIRDVMTDVVETLRIGDPIDLASRLMRAGRIRHLPVIDGQEQLVGLVSHRAIMAAWLSHGDPSREAAGSVLREVPVEAIMERNVLTVTPDTTAAMGAALLESSKFGCLPVLEHGKLIGIVTEADFVTFARKHFEAEQGDSPGARGVG